MDFKSAIDTLWECKQQGIYFPSEWKGKLDVEQGYEIQLGILEKHLKNGNIHVGWKVGLTAKVIQEQLDFHERVFGYLLSSGLKRSGEIIEFDEMIAPSFETELCVTLGQDLKGPEVTPEMARAAIEKISPAFELVELRGEFTADPPLTMADNVQQKYIVTGPETNPLPGDVDLSKTTVEIFINGESVIQASGDAIMGGPEMSVAWLANKLSGFGRTLQAGMQVMTGSFTKQFPIAPGDVIEAEFSPFGTVMAEFK